MSPLNRYYDGKGARVMRDMRNRYGPKRGARVFYATHEKRRKLKRQPRRT